jgi:hypothetical protein
MLLQSQFGLSFHLIQGKPHAVMGILADYISLLVNLNIGPDSSHLLDPVKQFFLDDRRVMFSDFETLSGLFMTCLVFAQHGL